MRFCKGQLSRRGSRYPVLSYPVLLSPPQRKASRIRYPSTLACSAFQYHRYSRERLLLREPQYHCKCTGNEREHGGSHLLGPRKWKPRCLLNLCRHEHQFCKPGNRRAHRRRWIHHSCGSRLHGFSAALQGRAQKFRPRCGLLHCSRKLQHVLYSRRKVVALGIRSYGGILRILRMLCNGMALVARTTEGKKTANCHDEEPLRNAGR
jgi:hypothetical protein